ncbi:hypothetical protein QS257_20725 [Terrilactibacillus sp. S3-3]|nr:hypothetical protein QS257_20725 [Terrilactibacillus sp. S3-3]
MRLASRNGQCRCSVKPKIGLQSMIAAANASEAATGRDLDGNELTDEQRMNSLLMSLTIMRGLSSSRVAVAGEKHTTEALGKSAKEHVKQAKQKMDEMFNNLSGHHLAYAGETGVVGKVEKGSADSVQQTHQMAKSEKVDGVSGREDEKVGTGKSIEADPSKIARNWQGKYPYVGIDKYRNITLKKGKIIYVGEP